MSLLMVPPTVLVTAIGPVVAPVGTVALSCVSAAAKKLWAAVPLKYTDLVPVKFHPRRITNVPTGPMLVSNESMIGALVTVKLRLLVPAPKLLVTVIGPVVAVFGTVTVTWPATEVSRPA